MELLNLSRGPRRYAAVLIYHEDAERHEKVPEGAQ